MISQLNDLETRRKILFANEAVIIRSLADECVLVTIGPCCSKSDLKQIQHFLNLQFLARPIKAVVLDISRTNISSIVNCLTIGSANVSEAKGLAILANSRLLGTIFKLLSFRNEFSHRIKTFKNLQLAVSWSRTLK